MCQGRDVSDALRQAVLDLGLEDHIPLWEVASDCEAAGLLPRGRDGVETLAALLLELATEDKVRILTGHWDDPEPRYVSVDEAAGLLTDARYYSSDEEMAHDLTRVYYVNVDNIVD